MGRAVLVVEVVTGEGDAKVETILEEIRKRRTRPRAKARMSRRRWYLSTASTKRQRTIKRTTKIDARKNKVTRTTPRTGEKMTPLIPIVVLVGLLEGEDGMQLANDKVEANV